MSFYGNVTQYLTNAFGRMAFQNYAVLDNQNKRVQNQRSNWTNAATHLTGNTMGYKMDFSPSNSNDVMILALGNRWLTFAKNDGNNDEINGNNTILLYHTLPTEFVNDTQDGANNAYGPGGELNPDHILNVIDTDYYPVRQIVGRNYSQDTDQEDCFPEINSTILENEVAGMVVPEDIESLTQDEIDELKEMYEPQIPYADWGDIIALPQIMFDEAGHIVYGGYNYVRLQEEPQLVAEVEGVKNNIEAILHILGGSKLSNDPDLEEIGEALRNSYDSILKADSYYNNQGRNTPINIINRLRDIDNTLNTVYLSDDSVINNLKVQVGVSYRNGNVITDYGAGVADINKGGLIKKVAELAQQTENANQGQTAILSLISQLINRVNALITVVNEQHGTEIEVIDTLVPVINNDDNNNDDNDDNNP